MASKSKTADKPGLNALLKWPGGKRWLFPIAARYAKRYPQSRWVEPFAGGMALALGMMPMRALLNDANPHLMNFYQQVRDGLKLPKRVKLDEASYYKARDRFNELIRRNKALTAEGAQLWWYLNRTGYNGLCRFNARGYFNVPCGKYKKQPQIPDLLPYQILFRQWEFHYGDFSQLAVEPGDFILADPPYVESFDDYATGGFDWSDQERLVAWLSEHDGPVIACNKASKAIVRLYKQYGFRIRYEHAPRAIACNGGRKPEKEMLALKLPDMKKRTISLPGWTGVNFDTLPYIT